MFKLEPLDDTQRGESRMVTPSLFIGNVFHNDLIDLIHEPSTGRPAVPSDILDWH